MYDSLDFMEQNVRLQVQEGNAIVNHQGDPVGYFNWIKALIINKGSSIDNARQKAKSSIPKLKLEKGQSLEDFNDKFILLRNVLIELETSWTEARYIVQYTKSLNGTRYVRAIDQIRENKDKYPTLADAMQRCVTMDMEEEEDADDEEGNAKQDGGLEMIAALKQEVVGLTRQLESKKGKKRPRVETPCELCAKEFPNQLFRSRSHVEADCNVKRWRANKAAEKEKQQKS
jgi:hypothetical protein